jgi:hypothetical protein
MAARIIPFPGPKPKDLFTDLQAAASTIGHAPVATRALTEREVEHRRQMLMHLQLVRDATHAR